MSNELERRLPEHVTMPLLELITQQSLDVDYRQVADRRAQLAAASRERGEEVAALPTEGEDAVRRLRLGSVAAVALLGLLITVAAVQTSRNAPEVANSREALIHQVQARSQEVSGLQQKLRLLKEGNTDLQSELESVTADRQAAQARTLRLGAGTGFTPVHGPGLRIVVNDGPDGLDQSRVRDEDLAVLVDGLWSAGAEAISINGHRLTALSPIRSSSFAIHVDNKPISPPYVVSAIGDPASLESLFADTTHGVKWLSLVQALGFVYEPTREDRMELPGARLPVLRDTRLLETAQGKEEVEP